MLKERLLLVVGIAAVNCVSFDPTRDCAVPISSPCHCTATDVDCARRNITRLPIFKRGNNWIFKLLDLSSNLITSIPAQAFQNINVSTILLNNNRIQYIHIDAFSGMQNEITTLNLENNRLATIPNGIGRLTNLRKLNVKLNPIYWWGFGDYVMREIGDYIKEFHFGDTSLTQWPLTIHHFPRLEILNYFGGQMEQLPMNAFAGFEWTLQELWIQNTNLISVPKAMKDLKTAHELHFDNNVRVGDAGILIRAFTGLAKSLNTLTLENNTLTEFPSALLTLGELHNLSLARNDIQFISDQSINVIVSNLTTINLQLCNLDRIPGALSKLRGVINLDFSKNSITTIERTDLQHLTNLQSLNISNNPLRYISKSTFYDLKSLQELVLQNSYLYSVPEAIKNIPTLRELDLTVDPPSIECICETAQWLSCYMAVRNTHLDIIGQCNNIVETITNYATKIIPTICPIRCYSIAPTSVSPPATTDSTTGTTDPYCWVVGRHCMQSPGVMSFDLHSMHPSICRDHMPAVKCYYHAKADAGCLPTQVFNRIQPTNLTIDDRIALACDLSTESCQAANMECRFTTFLYVPAIPADVADLPDVGNMNLRWVSPAIYKICSESCMPTAVDVCPFYAQLYLDTVIDDLVLPRTDERKAMLTGFIRRSCPQIFSFRDQIECVDEELYSSPFAECIATALDAEPMADNRTVSVGWYEHVTRCVNETVGDKCNSTSAEMVIDGMVLLDVDIVDVRTSSATDVTTNSATDVSTNSATDVGTNSATTVAMKLTFMFTVAMCVMCIH